MLFKIYYKAQTDALQIVCTPCILYNQLQKDNSYCSLKQSFFFTNYLPGELIKIYKALVMKIDCHVNIGMSQF